MYNLGIILNYEFFFFQGYMYLESISFLWGYAFSLDYSECYRSDKIQKMLLSQR